VASSAGKATIENRKEQSTALSIKTPNLARNIIVVGSKKAQAPAVDIAPALTETPSVETARSVRAARSAWAVLFIGLQHSIPAGSLHLKVVLAPALGRWEPSISVGGPRPVLSVALREPSILVGGPRLEGVLSVARDDRELSMPVRIPVGCPMKATARWTV